MRELKPSDDLAVRSSGQASEENGEERVITRGVEGADGRAAGQSVT